MPDPAVPRPRKSGRNPNGAGSDIRRRPDGRYTASIRLPDGRRKSLYGRTRAEVRSRLAAVRTQLAQRLPVPAERLLLSAYLDDWLTGAAPRLRPRTLARYRELVRLYLGPALGRRPLGQLASADVRACYAALLGRGLSPNTVRMAHAVLHRALEQAVDDGVLGRNPARSGLAPGPARFTPAVLALADARRLLAAVAGDADQALYWLALSTGLRQGELLALRWADVDLGAGELHVRGTLHWQSGQWRIGPPKSKAGERVVLLGERVRAELAAHRDAGSGEGFVFADAGQPLTAVAVRAGFRRLLVRAGLPAGLRFHDLRHALATLLADDGVPASVLAGILGHSRVGMTLDRYVHAQTAAQGQAVAALGRLLGPRDGATAGG